jgi:hypothetical protein
MPPRIKCHYTTMKPDTATAMRDLIRQARESIPFDAPETETCADECRGCSVKLLEYLQAELETWEYRLECGETPDFKDLSQLARSCRKIHQTLKKNGVIGD